MSAPSPHRVVIDGEPGAYSVTVLPHGTKYAVSRFSDVLMLGDKLRCERACGLFNDTAIKPLAGDRGPAHLIGGPLIFVVDEGDCWEVVMLFGPRAFGPKSQAFVGPNAAQAAERFGRMQFNSLRAMALAEHVRIERMKELRRRERAAMRQREDAR